MTKIEALEGRIKELESQKGKNPAIDAGIQMIIDEINDRLSYLRAGRPDPYE